MAVFVYKPEGADEMRWEFKPSKLMSPEMEAIERVTGMTYGQWSEAMGNGSALGTRALLWIMLKRKTPDLKFEQVEFNLDEIDFEDDADEAAADPKEESVPESSGDSDT